MVQFTSLVRGATSAALALALAACVGIRGLSPAKSYTTNTTIQLPRRATNFIPTASEVGQSLGYRVSGTDTERSAVTLTDSVDGMVLHSLAVTCSEPSYWHCNPMVAPSGSTSR